MLIDVTASKRAQGSAQNKVEKANLVLLPAFVQLYFYLFLIVRGWPVFMAAC